MAAQLLIAERQLGGVTILDLSGHLVADEEDVLFTGRVDALLAAGKHNVVVNLARVTIIDSGGIGTLVAKYLSARRHGGDLRLLNLTPRTRRVLEMTRLIDVFASFESEEAAVRSFAPDHATA